MAEKRVQRRLAAIMVADVVGYSRLMEADEEGTRARLKSLFSELIDPRIAADGGRIVKTMGDGILVEFGSAVDAVRNALDIQGVMRRRNADISEDTRIEFRVGINVGDVIVEGDDIHGEGVNVAARLEGLCGTGEVYVSGTVYDQAAGKLTASFEDLGEQTVKNISKPLRVYRAHSGLGAEQGGHQGTDSLRSPPDKPSIAILPFENLSGDAEQEYFSDGISEDIITDLSKISGLFVIARNSSFTYKGQSIDIRRVARDLGVQNVLEGSVRKVGTRVRINAQLIDAVSGGHLWAERYDGDLDDIFSLQDEITGKIVSALEVRLTESERERERRFYIPNWEAYDCFIKGRYIVTEHYFKFSQRSGEPPSEANLLSARRQFELAIERDSGFAGGYAGLSWTYALGVRHGLSDSPDNDREKAVQLAEQAVEIDKDFGWSHTALASARLVQRHYEAAISSARRAIELQPSDSDGYAYLGLSLICAGNPEDALAPIQAAFRLDPLYQPRTRAFLGIAYYGLRRFKEAVQELDTVNGPLNYAIHFTLAFMSSAYMQLGQTENAKDTVERLLNLYPGFTVDRFRRLFPYKNPADIEFVCDDLISAGLPNE